MSEAYTSCVMINRIERTNGDLQCSSPEHYFVPRNQQYKTSLVSAKINSCSNVWQLVSWIFFPFTWILSKVGITTEELEISEELIEGVLRAGGIFFYDCSIGEVQLNELISSCDKLYQRLSNKWFPNLEGILFLRQNLIKIQIRAFAILGKAEKIKELKVLLESIGGQVSEDLEFQVDLLLSVTRHRALVRLTNLVVKIAFNLLSILSSRNIKNSKELP